LNQHGCLRYRLEARGAKAMDGNAADLDWQPGAQNDSASEVPALFGLRHSATQNQIVDLGRVQSWHAVQSSAYCNRCKVVGASRCEGPAPGPAHGGPNRAYDYCILRGLCHDVYLLQPVND
jgi:hypothetical protein